jgi:hypothetical protein
MTPTFFKVAAVHMMKKQALIKQELTAKLTDPLLNVADPALSAVKGVASDYIYNPLKSLFTRKEEEVETPVEENLTPEPKPEGEADVSPEVVVDPATLQVPPAVEAPLVAPPQKPVRLPEKNQ